MLDAHRATGRGKDLAGGFDYVIVGAGSAGCVVAGRLVEGTEATVLVLDQRHFTAVIDEVPHISHKIMAVLAGRIRYSFDDHSVDAGPGDMLHIPAGPAHRHKPSVVGDEMVRYVLTEFE